MVRGGAIGDFILTLPALKALRDAYPRAHIEILGYQQIASLAENRFYANAVRSIEHGPLSKFFVTDSELPTDLVEYFGSFDLVISYLYDPDAVFENNLRRCAVSNLVRGPAKIDNLSHATSQLVKPIQDLGLAVSYLAPRIHLLPDDQQFAYDFLRGLPRPIVALHPGSGSEKKNWPIENWIQLGAVSASLVLVGGEADEAQLSRLKTEWKDRRIRVARSLPLLQLAAIFSQSVFVGHDSGISHLAAAAGARAVLLFGPTDPAVWAPLNENVRLIRAPEGDLRRLDVEPVREAVDQELMRIGIST